MNRRHTHRWDSAAAERLLDGAAVDSQHGPDALTRLLAAARGPAQASELRGEPAAMAAFQAARAGLVSQPRRRSFGAAALAKATRATAETRQKARAWKAAAVGAAVAVAATGGVALAATSGALPNPLGGKTPAAEPRPDNGQDRPSATPTMKITGSPSPSLVGLCQAFTAGAGDNRGKALDSPAFGVLIDAAGDRNRVPAYCDAVLTAAGKVDRGRPGTGGRGNPSRGTPRHPTGKPDNPPKGPPSGVPNPAGGPGVESNRQPS